MTKKQTSHPLKDGEINILRANVNVNYTRLVHVGNEKATGNKHA